MPKRIPTPPPPEDEPRYLTVVHPYPLHANLELHADRRTLALWLACCTGKDVLLAMFHKPASPGMVVIEVDREFDRFDELLGLHAWSGFLLKPSEEQKDKSSKVFYCTYNTGRLVEKNGWKRVNIEEHWFHGWTRNNAIIKYPYPKTSYCDVPSEAKTGAPMCRPLPQRSFPVPPPKPAPIVGSPEWLASRNDNTSASPAPSSTKKGKKSVASDTASVTSARSRSTKSFSPPPTQSPTPSVMANYRAKNDPAWKRGPPSIASVASAVTSRAPSTVGTSSARSSRAAAAPPAPPGLGPVPTPQSLTPGRFNWSEDVERFESEKISNPPARSPAPSVSTGPARRQPYDPDGPIEPSRVYEYNEEDQPRHSAAAAMSDIFEDSIAPIATPVRSGRGGTKPLGIDDPDYDPWNPPAEVADPMDDESQAGEAETVWEDYPKPRQELPTKVKKKGTWDCPQHGPLCNPGICKERARVERDERIREENEKREKENRARAFRKAKDLQKREEKKEAEAEGEGDRGRGDTSGSSSSNGSDDDEPHDRDSNATPPPDPEDWSIPLNIGGADALSTVSSSRRAWGSVAGSDGEEDDENDDDEGASVAMSRTTNTSNTSRSSRATPPASVASSGRRKGPVPSATPLNNAGPGKISPTSPRPATRQSAWDARSVTSQSSSVMGGRSEWPSVTGSSRSSAVSGASATGSDTGKRSGTGPAARQSSRSSATSSARTGAGPATPSTPSASSGFPTFADTEWGDPIATALAKGGGKKSKHARKRENKARSAQVLAQAQAQAARANALDVELPPGGPGSQWGDPNETW
ncbi:hypothetical protein EDB87DRAFT_1578207 [Lactarius vividus]|nr:hypothetical protein EDB87DRAFT_1578207 [Lactarius vividus]